MLLADVADNAVKISVIEINSKKTIIYTTCVYQSKYI